MAGIYLHIPFCKQACHYCDFHFSTNQSGIGRMVGALAKELELRRAYIPSDVSTIYFGGGTPSLLSEAHLHLLLERMHAHFHIDAHAEITLEANPDDLSEAYLKLLKNAGINRLSIGIQSFHNPHLQFMHRAHVGEEATACVKRAQDAGISNISIDLIYGIPSHPAHEASGLSLAAVWEADMAQAFQLLPAHISAYGLTIEAQTVFGKWAKRGKLKPADEELAAQQFERLMDEMALQGFEHYEISNFGRPGCYSRHNTSYWQGVPYLGLGPSAHSYNGNTRQHNVANNARYMQAVEQGRIPCEIEELSVADRANDYLLTSLRTAWGCNLAHLEELGYDLPRIYGKELSAYLAQGYLRQDGSTIALTRAGKLIADKITEDFFWVP